MSFKVTKIVFDLIDEEGKKYKRYIEGIDDCEKWHEENVKMCQMAEELGIDYSWNRLNWIMKEVKKNDKNSSLLEEMLEGK